MIQWLLPFAALILLIALAMGLVRALRGPTLQDRMLAVQLMGSGGVALVLMLAQLTGSTALIDVALVLALLAVMAVAAMTRREAAHD